MRGGKRVESAHILVDKCGYMHICIYIYYKTIIYTSIYIHTYIDFLHKTIRRMDFYERRSPKKCTYVHTYVDIFIYMYIHTFIYLVTLIFTY